MSIVTHWNRSWGTGIILANIGFLLPSLQVPIPPTSATLFTPIASETPHANSATFEDLPTLFLILSSYPVNPNRVHRVLFETRNEKG